MIQYTMRWEEEFYILNLQEAHFLKALITNELGKLLVFVLKILQML